MREEEYVNKEQVFTPNEPWIVNRGNEHWYWASTAFVKEVLSVFPPGNCLVIGSPLAEVEALEGMGWRVTYLDIRNPTANFAIRDFVQADCREIPFPDGTFDAVSSACVVCHVGLGRYGDEVGANGDEKMLQEVARVLKANGPAVITFGPVTGRPLTVRHGNIHRVYTVSEVNRLAEQAGLSMQELRIWDAVNHKWVPEPDQGIQPAKYVSTVLRK